VQAGPELLRAINKQRVLHLVRSQGPLSRAEAASSTGLTRPTISSVVAELAAQGWVEERGVGESTGGRPPLMLQFRPQARWVIGAELGAGHLRAVLTDLDGNVRDRVKERVESSDPLVEVGRLEAAIRSVMAKAPNGAILAGIGLGITGIVDAKAGRWRYSPHFQVDDLPIARLLQDRIGLPVLIENDARAMAWGERTFGSARSAGDLAYIRVGVGIGAGFIIGGQLHRGASDGAGEIGHMVIDLEGRQCRCGSYGCLETMASATAIARQAARRIGRGEESIIRQMVEGDLARVIGSTVIEAAHAGDRVAMEILAEAGRDIGSAVGNLINLLNPSVVVIGGGTSRAGEALLGSIRQTALARTLPGLKEKVAIKVTVLGEDSCPLGGASLVMEELFRVPAVEVDDKGGKER
jgi:glucokinase-like ROK family protein